MQRELVIREIECTAAVNQQCPGMIGRIGQPNKIPMIRDRTGRNAAGRQRPDINPPIGTRGLERRLARFVDILHAQREQAQARRDRRERASNRGHHGVVLLLRVDPKDIVLADDQQALVILADRRVDQARATVPIRDVDFGLRAVRREIPRLRSRPVDEAPYQRVGRAGIERRDRMHVMQIVVEGPGRDRHV